MFISRRRIVNYSSRVTRTTMHRVVFPATIVSAYHAFSWATVIIPAYRLAVNNHMAVMPVHATKEKERRKMDAWRPIDIAMMMIAYVMTPANW